MTSNINVEIYDNYGSYELCTTSKNPCDFCELNEAKYGRFCTASIITINKEGLFGGYAGDMTIFWCEGCKNKKVKHMRKKEYYDKFINKKPE